MAENSKSPKAEPLVRNGIKILVFTSSYKPFIGGSEIALEEIASRLKQFEFDILTPRYSRKFPRQEKSNNVSIFRIGLGLYLDKLFFPLAGFLKAAFFCFKKKYSVVHVFQASYGGGAGWLLKIFCPSIKFIVTLQEGKDLDRQSFFIRFFRAMIIKKADSITAISEYLKNYARRYNRKAKIEVIPNGVDMGKISNFQFSISKILKENLNIKEKEKVIISVSRLVPKNGIGDLVDAFSKIITGKACNNLKLLIVGDGPLKESLMVKVKSKKIEEKVVFVGEIPHEETYNYLAVSDIFVRPSLSEGLGSAFLEAMAAGLPVVATRVGGIPDFIKDGETGVFCRERDPEDLAKKIIQVLQGDELRQRLTANGRNLIAEKYDWDKIAKKFIQFYET